MGDLTRYKHRCLNVTVKNYIVHKHILCSNYIRELLIYFFAFSNRRRFKTSFLLRGICEHIKDGAFWVVIS